MEHNSTAKLKLADFCNISELENILSNWYITTDMSVVIMDIDGYYITEMYGFSDYCKTIQSSKEGKCMCLSSTEDYKNICCHAGLCKMAVPIILPYGETIAYILCGQAKLPDSEKPDFNILAEKYKLDADLLSSKYEAVMVKKADKIEASKELISYTINSFVTQCYEEWQNKNQINDDQTLSQITQILYAYNITLNLETGKYSLIIGTGLERLVSNYKNTKDYVIAQNEAIQFVHPAYINNVSELLSIHNLRKLTDRNGHIDTIEYPVIYPGTNDYEWHEVNVFISHDDKGRNIANILGRDVTETHRLQEKNDREIRAAATRNQILSDLTKMLYSYNITLNLNTGKYTLIEGTGMTKVMEIFKSTDDYVTAYTKKAKLIIPEYAESFAAVASIEALRGHRDSHGFIGNLEYGANAEHGEEWHEINAFISTDELGNPIANILGRDITEVHKRQEQRDIAFKASMARDQLLSGVTKMLYSFNITVNLNSWKYSLITGTGCESWIKIMQATDDYVLGYNRIRNILDDSSKNILDKLCGISSLNNYINRSGFIGTITTSAISEENKSWQEINLFLGTNEYGDPIANILGRDITDAQLRQERKENELKASASKDQILSEITKSLYSYNITVNLETGKYVLITGTGMDEYVSFLKSTNDYEQAYEYSLNNVQNEYIDAYKELVAIKKLRGKSFISGHIGQLEYAANGLWGTEWHEINIFMGTNENGEAIANILGRDITEAHERQANREREVRAASARDQLLSGITKMLYSYNMTVDVNTEKYTLITGTGLSDMVKVMQQTDDYTEIIEQFKKSILPEYLERGLNFLSIDTYKNKIKQSGYVGTEEFPEMTNNGIEWHEINIFAGYDEEGNSVINILGRDVTEVHDRLDTKAKLEIAEASSRSKTQFLFNMSHDIRTPMNAIIGFTDLLYKHLDNRELAETYISKIKYSNEFLLSLINNVLEMARIESGKAILDETECCLNEFEDSLEAVFASQMEAKGLKFTIENDVEHQLLMADITKSKEVFLNIISNALKYTATAGSVSVKTTELPSKMEGWALYKTVIKDTGIGMSKEFLPHIYDEFSREKNSTESKVIGTGLGMPIVKSLVELMQGSIEVESELGKGTTFTVIIPHRFIENRTNKTQEIMNNSVIDEMEFKGKRILLAEDNDFNAEIVMEILTEAGFEIERAVDGVVCVDMLSKAPKHYYDVILMDIQMPNMDGYMATKLIRAINDNDIRNIPIFAMTANAFDEDKKNALAAGMNGHLAKPIEVQKLMEALYTVLK